MPKLNLTIPATIKAAIDRQVVAGDYAGADEYLQDLVRRDQRRKRSRRLEEMLLRRRDRRGAIEMNDADFNRIRRRFLDRVNSSRAA